jgi:hypothetical protein
VALALQAVVALMGTLQSGRITMLEKEAHDGLGRVMGAFPAKAKTAARVLI